MSTTMKFPSSAVFLVAAFLVVLPIVATATPTLTKLTFDHRDFVVSSCVQTLYPDVCLSTLAPYANATFDDPARLARIAVHVSLKEVQRFTASLTCLSRNATGAAKSALSDCIVNIANAGSAMRSSLGKMRQIVMAKTGQNLGVVISDVQTLISSAMTSEETCSDRFEEVGDGSSDVETEVRHGVNFSRMVTSNALSLIKYYVNDQRNA